MVRRRQRAADSVTARYLREVDHPVLPFPESEFAKAHFAGRYLSRPVFWEAGELSGLERDLSLVRSALGTLPERRYGGDLTGFARAAGLPGPQAEFIVRGEGPSRRGLTCMARADLYRDAGGFRLLEWNLGSSAGGAECADLCRALLAVPELAAFAAREGLAYADTVEAMAGTLRAETGYPAGTDPVVALVGNPRSFPEMRTAMCHKAAALADAGLATVVGHLGELARSGGRLCLRGEPVDVVFRLFTMGEAVAQAGGGLLEPLLSAAERGEVVLFTPLSTGVFGSKGALALLSEPAGQAGLTPEQREACGRLVPWTRLLDAGEAVLEDGGRVDLLSYVLGHQDDLVLKPSLSYGGNGVLVGADPDIAPAMWRDRVAEAAGAAGGSYVVQRRVRPVPELFPSAAGPPVPWTVAWGVFTMRQGYAGTFTRAVPADAGETITNLTRGALVGCGFHARACGAVPTAAPGAA